MTAILEPVSASRGTQATAVRTAEPSELLRIDLMSFGFKFGVPLKADVVFDVRFLANPFWVPELRALSGLEPKVRAFVLGQPEAGRFLDLAAELVRLTIAGDRSEGRSRLTVALGCTGGFHRSIVLAEELATRLAGTEGAAVAVFHRDLER